MHGYTNWLVLRAVLSCLVGGRCRHIEVKHLPCPANVNLGKPSSYYLLISHFLSFPHFPYTFIIFVHLHLKKMAGAQPAALTLDGGDPRQMSIAGSTLEQYSRVAIRRTHDPSVSFEE